MRPVLTLASRFARVLKPTLSKVQIESISQGQNSPLFQRHVPWWARWTWALIACDIFMTGSAIELTYNHWTVSSNTAEDGEKKPASKDTLTEEAYILRPMWQRSGVCAAHLVFGAGIAAALLITQTRFVRTLAIVPSSSLSGERHVFLQCAHNLKGNGVIAPFSRCSLSKGRNDTEAILRVKGEMGHWYVGFENCQISGHRHSAVRARAEFLAAWEGKSVGTFLPVEKDEVRIDRRWKSGPLRRASER